MADFDDMTGWREEYHAWLNSEEFKMLPVISTGRLPKIPLSKIFKLIELELKNPECTAAHQEIFEWHANNPDPFFDFDETTYPNAASNTLGDFISWFRWKADMPIHSLGFSNVSRVITDIRRGVIGASNREEIIDGLRKNSGDCVIDFED